MKFYPDEIPYDRALFTAFDREALDRLPQKYPMDPPFEAVLLDTETGKEYRVRQNYPAYEATEVYCPEAEDLVEAHSLQPYFYAAHWCGCHRIQSIEESNPGVDLNIPPRPVGESYCPTGRFLVKQLTYPSLPGVVLMREE